MRYLFSFILSIWLCSILSAQEFDVRSFEADPTDLAARRYEKRTVNDEPAALIKVVTNISGMIFDSNLGIVDVEHREAEYWVYVAPRERRIRLMAPEFLAKDVSLPEPARSNTVYHLVVTRKGTLAPITDLVRLTFKLNQSDVYIRRGDQAPISSVGNIAVFNIEKGEHSFRFIKNGFDEKTLTLDVLYDDEVLVELMPGRVTTPFEPPGFIVINSEQRGAEVYLNEQRVGVTPYQNSHISGQYTLTLRHPDYHDHFQSFSLEAGATMTVPTVNLLPRYGFYEVTSSPSGADVLINNRQVGTTPILKTKINSDHHELTVRYPMYHDHKETFTINDGDSMRFNVELKPAFGGLRITSEPSGSKVFLDGREVGVTPYVNLQKASGRYSIRISRNLYADAVENIVINDNETTERFIPLAQNFGSLQVQADNADIYIDGEHVGRDSETVDLTPGRYFLRALKPQHHDDEREVFIRLGQTERITLSPVPKTGYLSIASEPFEASGAEIWIDGRRQEQRTPAVIPLLEGIYELRVTNEGYIDAVTQVRIEEGKTLHEIITFTNEMREEFIREQERIAKEEHLRQQEARQQEELLAILRLKEREEQKEHRQQTIKQLFMQEKYWFLNLSYARPNLNTPNFLMNIKSSHGVNAGFNYFGKYWCFNIGVGYDYLGLSNQAALDFGFDDVDIFYFYTGIGPKLRFWIFDVFVMVGYEGFYGRYNDEKLFSSEDFIFNYGGNILPRKWRVGFLYSRSVALGLLDTYPPFSRHNFGLVIKI